MRRAAVQMGFCADLADAQFLMFEAERVENLRRPIDYMDAVAIRLTFGCALKSAVGAQRGAIFSLSHMARLRFAMLLKPHHSVNQITTKRSMIFGYLIC